MTAMGHRADDGLEALADAGASSCLSRSWSPPHRGICRSEPSRFGTLPSRYSVGRVHVPSRSSRSRASSEERSWKGMAGVGVQEGEARDFYQEVAQRLAECGELRVLLGRQARRDVVFVLGGVFGDTFRGLQMSFDDELRDLSLGNLGQYETMQALAAEGVAQYDLGTEMPYKMRWAPEGLETVTLALFPDA